jgi:hypothetical protein
MFSTYDQPQSKDSMESLTRAVVSSNKKDKEPSERSITPPVRASNAPSMGEHDNDEDEDMLEDQEEDDEEDEEEDGPEIFDAFLDQVLAATGNQLEDDEEEERQAAAIFADVPVIHPRAYYAGTRNTATVKDGE